MTSIGLPFLAPDRDEQCSTTIHNVLVSPASNVPAAEQRDPVALIFSNAILKSLTSSDPALETAGSIWHAGHALALYLIDHPSIVQGKHVLELGSGCGLVGLIAAALGAKTVVLTDLATQQLHLQRNIELTRGLWSPQCDSVVTATLPFGDFCPHLFSAEVLLGADIGYDPSLHEPISRTVAEFLRDEAESHDRNEQKKEYENEPNDGREKCAGSNRGEENDDIIVAKTTSETMKSTKIALLAEEIRWKDVYAWYQEALQEMDTGEYEQIRTTLKTRANLRDDNSLGEQIPRKHPIELTTILRTAADETVSAN